MKPWWQSKTLWANTIAAALVALEANMGVLQPHVPVNVYALFAFALPIVNAALRIVTSQGLTLR